MGAVYLVFSKMLCSGMKLHFWYRILTGNITFNSKYTEEYLHKLSKLWATINVIVVDHYDTHYQVDYIP